MSESDTNNTQPLDHWSSDDLEADADAGPKQQAPHAAQEWASCTQANGGSQVGPTQNGADATLSGPMDPGGARCALDMTDERDRGMVRKALMKRPRRWAGVDADFKAQMVEGLKEAAAVARECIAAKVDPLDAAKVIASVVRTAVAIEDQCQKDEHRAEDQERIDSGKATGAIKLYGHEAPTHLV